MKKLLLLSALVFIPLTVSAVGVAGQRRDGTIDPAYVARSVKAKTTIRTCGTGRMRSVRNYQVKCDIIQRGRLRNTRSVKSNLLNKRRYRGTTAPSVRRTQSTTRKSVEAIKAAYWAKWRKLKATMK